MKILIIDDSPIVRAITKDYLQELSFIESIETASNGKIALEMISKDHFDLIFLDVEMPALNGIEFLEQKKKMNNTIPVIMLSSYTQKGAEITFKALELGAVDFIPKPIENKYTLDDIKDDIQKKVWYFYEGIINKTNKATFKKIPQKTKSKKNLTDYKVVVIGSSTGGPNVLSNIIKKIPKDFPLPIVIIQHMPEYFTEVFANRLAKESFLEVLEAKENLELQKGRIILAKGGKHLIFKEKNQRVFCHLTDEPKINGVRPSIDKTLFSLIEIFSENIIGIILTGMGRDGVDALKLLHNKGGLVIAQDENTSLIFGMNKRAIEENIVDEILSYEKIVDYLLEM